VFIRLDFTKLLLEKVDMASFAKQGQNYKMDCWRRRKGCFILRNKEEVTVPKIIATVSRSSMSFELSSTLRELLYSLTVHHFMACKVLSASLHEGQSGNSYSSRKV